MQACHSTVLALSPFFTELCYRLTHQVTTGVHCTCNRQLRPNFSRHIRHHCCSLRQVSPPPHMRQEPNSYRRNVVRDCTVQCVLCSSCQLEQHRRRQASNVQGPILTPKTSKIAVPPLQRPANPTCIRHCLMMGVKLCLLPIPHFCCISNDWGKNNQLCLWFAFPGHKRYLEFQT